MVKPHTKGAKNARRTQSFYERCIPNRMRFSKCVKRAYTQLLRSGYSGKRTKTSERKMTSEREIKKGVKHATAPADLSIGQVQTCSWVEKLSNLRTLFYAIILRNDRKAHSTTSLIVPHATNRTALSGIFKRSPNQSLTPAGARCKTSTRHKILL